MTYSQLVRHLSCRLWGHAVDNRAFHDSTSRKRRCRCGADYLGEDGTFTRVRHTLSCFLRHHTYERLAGPGRAQRVCVRQVRPSAGIPRRGGPLRRARAIREESPLSMRPVRPSRPSGDRARRLHRVHVLLRALVPQDWASGAESQASAGLLLHGPPDPIRGPPRRLCRVRVSRLRAPVLLCRCGTNRRPSPRSATRRHLRLC